VKRIKIVHRVPIKQIVNIGPKAERIDPAEVARALGAERIPASEVSRYLYRFFYGLGR
jgi:hypothetical protein